jgi:serine/threonine protein kinase
LFFDDIYCYYFKNSFALDLVKNPIKNNKQNLSFLVENIEDGILSTLKVIKNVNKAQTNLVENIISLWQKAENLSFCIVRYYKHWCETINTDINGNSENNNNIFILEEYIHGENLLEKNKRMKKTKKKYTEKEIRKYGTELLEGIYSLFFVGFFEKIKKCDFMLKNENIYFSEQESLKIDLDFSFCLNSFFNTATSDNEDCKFIFLFFFNYKNNINKIKKKNFFF